MDVEPLQELLPTIPALAKLLQDTRHEHVQISPGGEVTILQDGAPYAHGTPLPQAQAQRVASAIGRHGDVYGAWRVHRLEGRLGPTLFFVRGPARHPSVEPVLDTIQRRVSEHDNILILGAPGQGQLEVATALARARGATLVSEPAPALDALGGVPHLYPAPGPGLRPALLHARAVVWHDLVHLKELAIALGAAGARGRCWTLNAHGTTSGLMTFSGWMRAVPDFSLDAIVVLARDPRAQVIIEHLLTRDATGAWTEHLHQDPSLATLAEEVFGDQAPSPAPSAPRMESLTRTIEESPILLTTTTQDLSAEEVLQQQELREASEPPPETRPEQPALGQMIPEEAPERTRASSTLQEIFEDSDAHQIHFPDTSQEPEPEPSIFAPKSQIIVKPRARIEPQHDTDMELPVSPQLANLVAELDEDSDELDPLDLQLSGSRADPPTQEFLTDELSEPVVDDPLAEHEDSTQALLLGEVFEDIAATTSGTQDAITTNVPSKEIDDVLSQLSEPIIDAPPEPLPIPQPPEDLVDPEAAEPTMITTIPTHFPEPAPALTPAPTPAPAELSWGDDEVTTQRSAHDIEPPDVDEASSSTSMQLSTLSLKLKALREKRRLTEEGEAFSRDD